jgi:glutamine synthetase
MLPALTSPVELEFFNFQTPSEDGYDVGRPDVAAFLKGNHASKLRPLTQGMFGYSVSRPLMSKDYFHSIYDTALAMGCPLEGWHTESGPGVYEAVSHRPRPVVCIACIPWIKCEC